MIFALLLSVVLAGPAEQRQCVVNEARAQFGKPYVWGAIGPDEFDCSGLVMYTYIECGYEFNDDRPYTGSLIDMGIGVDESELILADLVFPHSGHVQIYSGNGNIIHAPKSGDVVKEQSLYAFWAGRRLISGDENVTPDTPDTEPLYENSKVLVITEVLNIRAEPSTSSAIPRTYANGEKIIFDSFVSAEGLQWLSYIGDSGYRRYYCSRYSDGTCYTDPCAVLGAGTTTITQDLTIRDATSVDSAAVGYFSAGDSINYDIVFSRGSRVWISWVDGDQRKYAVCKSDAGVYCNPCPA